MLQNYLNSNLLPITEEAQLTKLKKATDELVKKLQKQKNRISTFTLILLDTETPADLPEVLEVKEIIIKNWSTYANVSKDTPMTFIRAVILEALQVVSRDKVLANLIWQTARNISRYSRMVIKEKQIISDFLTDLAKNVQSEAEQINKIAPEKTLLDLKIEFEEAGTLIIDKASFLKKMEAAAGPHNSESIAGSTSPNPNWPNSGHQWSYDFAPRAATAIGDLVNISLKEQAKAINKSQLQVATKINKVIQELYSKVLESNKTLTLRTNLIWWKESAYSHSTKCSYRDLEPVVLEVVMALDYLDIVPVFFPSSVDFFYLEVHSSLSEETVIASPLQEILEKVAILSEELKKIIPNNEITASRIGLLDFVRGLVHGVHKLADFNSLVGVNPATSELTPRDFSLWLFHDLQAEKISKIK